MANTKSAEKQNRQAIKHRARNAHVTSTVRTEVRKFRDVLGGGDATGAIYVGNKAAGRFMVQRVFSPGRTLPWNQLARHATGAELNAKAFADDLQTR